MFLIKVVLVKDTTVAVWSVSGRMESIIDETFLEFAFSIDSRTPAFKLLKYRTQMIRDD
jgi:hypothetical protein